MYYAYQFVHEFGVRRCSSAERKQRNVLRKGEEDAYREGEERE